MERKFKDTPPRLGRAFQNYDLPLYLVTFNTLLRRPLLACEPVHAEFLDYAGRGDAFHVGTGRYVLMPDHVHVFVRIGRDMTLRRWESGLKQRLGKVLAGRGHAPTTIPGSKLASFWQPGFFDHLLPRSLRALDREWWSARGPRRAPPSRTLFEKSLCQQRNLFVSHRMRTNVDFDRMKKIGRRTWTRRPRASALGCVTRNCKSGGSYFETPHRNRSINFKFQICREAFALRRRSSLTDIFSRTNTYQFPSRTVPAHD